MSKIRLVMQNNLISENDLGQIQQACKEAGAEVQEIKVVPFSEEIPEFTYNRKNLYYGSTTLMYNIYNQLKDPIGLFYDDEYFIIECGCLNSVGFYHADINKLFKSIIEWMEKQ